MKPTTKIIKRYPKMIDYIPVQLRSNNGCELADYYSIRKGKRSLLELTFDQANSLIHRITLLLCENFYRLDEMYQLPESYEVGDVLIDFPGEIETSLFFCTMYKNAVKITVADYPCNLRILSENIVWELSDTGVLISLCIIDSSAKVVEHCYQELSSGS